METKEPGTALAPDITLAMLMRKELLRLAKAEEDLAAAEAARVPYWSACPVSVIARRAAAQTLREDADRFLVRPDRVRAAS